MGAKPGLPDPEADVESETRVEAGGDSGGVWLRILGGDQAQPQETAHAGIQVWYCFYKVNRLVL